MVNIKILFSVFTLILIFSCGDDKKEDVEVLRPVKYIEISEANNFRTRKFTGVAKAEIEFDISFKINGTISYLPVKIGDKVKKYQLIAQLDPRDYIVEKQQIEASLASSVAKARNADSDYARTKALYENNNVSKGELDAARATSESANAQVKADQKRLEYANLQIDYTNLRSPVDGLIAEVPVEVNENVSTGKKIARITAGSSSKVSIEIPESLISEIKKGESVEVSFDAIPDRLYTAKIIEVGVASTSVSTTFPVTVLIQNKEEKILPGMAAEVLFKFKSNKQSNLLVPVVSVLEDVDGKYVYVLDNLETYEKNQKSAIVRRKKINVGEITPDGIEILSGIEKGQLVVTAGVRRINDGLKVRITKD
ncbi:MAG: efflux RND transporter periplasmic adaptor subunit [Candidatus Dadabacteria bacterium]|nr:efflux RND transporter periplasmic adaptor subunit [Candidatus Dadabacteria bacterium]NIQ16018.1 efflux RND transporter periplasmic adaptor subunit [Candidatus Dadabacteria bacterium]